MSVTKIPVDGLSGGEGILSAAYTGVLETNATFVDQAIFGPSVDGQAWNGKWSVASLYSSLMLVTIEDAGADTQVNIWDLTEVSSSAPSTTPLGTVTLSGDATPTCVAACMGYIIVGSEDGISIIDPHSGSWAERTAGWPRSLSTSTTPALTNNDVVAVAAGFSDAPTLDPRTGGYMPTFAVNYGTGADIGSVLKDDGNVWDKSGTVGNTGAYIKSSGLVGFANNTGNDQVTEVGPISIITADDPTGKAFLTTDSAGYGFGAGTALTVGSDGTVFSASASGLSQAKFTNYNGTFAEKPVTALINRTYNSGALSYDIRGAWLANSKTADRSFRSNTLTENGTVTEAAVESGAELKGYSGWSASNYLYATAADADFEMGTAAFSWSFWYKCGAASGTDIVMYYRNSSDGSTPQWGVYHTSTTIGATINDGSNAATAVFTDTSTFDSTWHKHDVNWSGATGILDSYIDGVLVATATNASVGSVSGGANFRVTLGESPEAGGYPFTGSLSLVRISATLPTATQIRQMYDAEKPMFVANAECLLQSSSTDAVLDVDVDPLTGKVLVTQTDAITIFDGLAIDSKPTVNSGNSEKGKLWGDLRAEQNSANAYVTAPAVDQRQVNEMVRGLASDLPKGVDLSKAKAWIVLDPSNNAISASFNVKSVNHISAGRSIILWSTPFKSDNYCITTGWVNNSGSPWDATLEVQSIDADGCSLRCLSDVGGGLDLDYNTCVAFGELENE